MVNQQKAPKSAQQIIFGLMLLSLFLLNLKTLNFGIAADYIGIISSLVLFGVFGRPTNLKLSFFLVPIIFILEFVSFRLHTKSLHFLALTIFCCLGFYYFTKRFSFIAFICIVLFSSVFNKFFEHLTVEIKQFLCEIVFYSLQSVIGIDRIEGVNFYIKNQKITVDTACMGLSMFKTGLLFGAILLSLNEKKCNKYYQVFQIFMFAFIIIILNVLSNYFRIIALLITQSTEENFLHHSIGILCFLVYQIVPMIFMLRLFVPKKAIINSDNMQTNKAFIIASFGIILLTSQQMNTLMEDSILFDLEKNYNLKNGSWVTSDVFKIQTSTKLTYIKSVSHKPVICWTGNGYSITESRKILTGTDEKWYNKMEKNKVIYHSFWWYECEHKKYTSFVHIMFIKLIYNKPICLINEVSVIKAL